MMDLSGGEFRHAAFLQGLVAAPEVWYAGSELDRIQGFKMVAPEGESWLFAAHIMRRDDGYVWESSRDMVDASVKQAALSVRGVYRFELLCFEPGQELKTFRYQELAQMIVNTSRTLKPGQEALIRYSTVYGILRQTLDEAWGKISLATSVELLADQPRAWVALLSRLWKTAGSKECQVRLLVNDMSFTPLFAPAVSEEWQILWDDFCARISKTPPAFAREIYLRDASGMRNIY
jgi:hypothetical protein